MKYIANILGSASKLAFLAVTATVCAGLFVGVVSEDTFKVLAGAAFTYYFTKGTPPVDAGK